MGWRSRSGIIVQSAVGRKQSAVGSSRRQMSEVRSQKLAENRRQWAVKARTRRHCLRVLLYFVHLVVSLVLVGGGDEVGNHAAAVAALEADETHVADLGGGGEVLLEGEAEGLGEHEG